MRKFFYVWAAIGAILFMVGQPVAAITAIVAAFCFLELAIEAEDTALFNLIERDNKRRKANDTPRT